MKHFTKTVAQLNALADDGIVPGINYLLFQGQESIRETRGFAQTRPVPEILTPDMQYDLASLTKVLGTVPVIMMLVQEEKIAIDDPVQKYLPEFGDARPTIRHLLTPTSGISGYIPPRDQLSPQELKRAFLIQQRVDSSFNRQIRYTDVNFLYLGWIIEAVCRQSVQTVITERVLHPLGLAGATFHPAADQCVPTEIQPGRGLIRGTVHDPKAFVLGAHCGCAGLFASMADLERFSHALIETNLAGLLTSKTVDCLFRDQTPLSGPHSRSFGWKLLHSRASDRHLLISHTGFTGTWLILDRQTDQGMIVLTNRVHPTAKNQAYLDRRDRIFASYLAEMQMA